MKKIGLFGIIIGSVMLLFIIALACLAYFRGLWNLRQYGAELYLPKLLLEIWKESWSVILNLIVLGVANLILGVNMFKNRLAALKLWIVLYAVLGVYQSIVLLIDGLSFSIFELDFLFTLLIILFSSITFKRINKNFK